MFARDINVVPSRVWVNKVNGRQASIFGAVPWTSEAEKEEWEEQVRGYTWEVVRNDGSVTYGLCRPPAKTLEEAEEVRRKVLAL